MYEKMRAEFEEWITSTPLEKPVHRNPESSGFPGQYRAYEVQLAWESWQASRAALVVELPKSHPRHRDSCIDVMDAELVVEAIEYAGVRVKQ